MRGGGAATEVEGLGCLSLRHAHMGKESVWLSAYCRRMRECTILQVHV